MDGAKNRGGGTAFPAIRIISGDNYNRPMQVHTTGMMLRDYFAAQAMQAHITALSDWPAPSKDAWHAEVARLAYMTADAMLEAREIDQ